MLSLQGITKSFGAHPALAGVDMEISAGEIHGLAGLNGSGKSTLLHILFGSSVIHATGGHGGQCLLDGEPVRFASPAQAMAAGIGLVHQEFALIPQLSVAANIMLNREKGYPLSEAFLPRDLVLLDSRPNERSAQLALAELGLTVAPRQQVGKLSITVRQFIEIARELSRDDLRLLLLDEPTAVLGSTDASHFLCALRKLRDKGVAILFVSHRLQEMLSVCDRVTVLRDGRSIASCPVHTTTPDDVIRLMTHTTVAKARRIRVRPAGEPLMRLENFRVAMPGEELCGLDLDIHRGEILGVVSLSGHGKLALGTGVIGRLPYSGRLYYENSRLDPSSCAEMVGKGIFFLSEDRGRLGFFADQSIMDNIVFSALHHRRRFLHPLLSGWLGLPDRRAILRHGKRCVEKFDIRCTGPAQPVSELSGGNQQKVRIAHALTLSPQLLLVNEPTRGVDIAAKERILDLFLTANEQDGTTIVIASSELEELRRICDRIAVLYRGRLHAILDPAVDELAFGNAISGEQVKN